VIRSEKQLESTDLRIALEPAATDTEDDGSDQHLSAGLAAAGSQSDAERQ